ncbi:MAG TPA: cation:proton antiporter [Tepidisphaeraceae bacterium]|nr:cation:proton antiporter [Tepidisphaeraceae bacterium]
MSMIEILLIQIAVILALSRVMGMLMRQINQPQVVGEMIAGILLGPSLLGLIHHGTWMNALFPRSSLGNLDVLSQMGVMLFMFLVGLELDPKLLRGQGKAALVTGTVGIVIPFVLGGSLAIALLHTQPQVTGNVASPLVLCLFMGAAMSITAFPVLARILTERNLHKTRTGVLALTCAAMDDIMGWCILAFVLAIAQFKGFGNQAHHGSAFRTAMMTVGLAAAYLLVMVFIVRKFLGRLQAIFDTLGYLTQGVMAIIFLILIGSSLATDAIGIHQIFGAFMFGAVMPKEGAFIKHLTEKVEDFTVLFLLPLFFAYTGLRTELGLLGSPQLWIICSIIVLTAVVGKFGGVTLAARFYGINWRQSGLLGVLMNTRGLMELIILNIGLTFHVLSPSLFAMMVVMALATTFMTTPFMRMLYSPARQKREMDEAAREEAAKVPGIHVVVPVSLKNTAASLVRISRMLMGSSPGRLYALHLERPFEVERRARTATIMPDEVLDVAIDTAKKQKMSFSAINFVSRNIGRDIADAAERYLARWIVMGWHKPIFSSNVLGGVVGQVLQRAPANVAIFCDKGLGPVSRILVPYLGEPQDREALDAVKHLASLNEVSVTVLQIRRESDQQDAREIPADVRFPDTADVRLIEAVDALKAIAEESAHHDLMVLGLSDEWNSSSGPLSGGHALLAETAQCSLLIVHPNPRAPVVESEAVMEPPADAEAMVGA